MRGAERHRLAEVSRRNRSAIERADRFLRRTQTERDSEGLLRRLYFEGKIDVEEFEERLMRRLQWDAGVDQPPEDWMERRQW